MCSDDKRELPTFVLLERLARALKDSPSPERDEAFLAQAAHVEREQVTSEQRHKEEGEERD